MKLVIDRSKWFRGRGGKDSKLIRREDGKMCCLGFFGCALGFERDELLEEADPESVGTPAYSKWPEWLAQPLIESYRRQTSECNRLVRLNDDKVCSETHREQGIAEIFAQHGVEVEFVDGGEP